MASIWCFALFTGVIAAVCENEKVANYIGFVYGPCTCVHDRNGRVHGRVHVYTARIRPWTRPVYTAVYTTV